MIWAHIKFKETCRHFLRGYVLGYGHGLGCRLVNPMSSDPNMYIMEFTSSTEFNQMKKALAPEIGSGDITMTETSLVA